jgi:hypothetical protein
MTTEEPEATTMATASLVTVAGAVAAAAANAAIHATAAAVTSNSLRLTASKGDGHQADEERRSDSIETLHFQTSKIRGVIHKGSNKKNATCVLLTVTKT